MEVRIRPLRETDAVISYKWRNNPEIWRYTERKPDQPITYEIEHKWLREVLKRPNEKRFAICVGNRDEYVGNIQLTDIISKKMAQFHIFIGESSYHNKGVGTRATGLLLDYAFYILELEMVYLFVQQDNASAIRLYEKCGFSSVGEFGKRIKMEVVNGQRV